MSYAEIKNADCFDAASTRKYSNGFRFDFTLEIEGKKKGKDKVVPPIGRSCLRGGAKLPVRLGWYRISVKEKDPASAVLKVAC